MRIPSIPKIAFSSVFSKTNLAILLVVLALIAAVMYFRSDAIKAKADLDLMTADRDALAFINEMNVEVVNSLIESQRANQKIAENVAVKERTVIARKNDAITEIQSERVKDESVETYLRQPVPDSVRRVLNR